MVTGHKYCEYNHIDYRCPPERLLVHGCLLQDASDQCNAMQCFRGKRDWAFAKLILYGTPRDAI